jgi:site-specific DNA-methyltransferase (adenine-specific)
MWTTEAGGRCRVIEGDCLQVMPTLPAASFDLVVTDPPYMVGAISVGNGNSKQGTWADMENSAYWYAAWMRECQRVLKPTGHLVTFGNWRSIPTLIRALSLCNWAAASCMVWDKEWIGPAGPKQLRPTWELCLFAGMPDAAIKDRAAPDVYRCRWMAGNCKKYGHPAEKPPRLVEHLVRLASPEGGSVLDCFAGSGTTAEAALAAGRSCTLIEREPAWCEVARRRAAGLPPDPALAPAPPEAEAQAA